MTVEPDRNRHGRGRPAVIEVEQAGRIRWVWLNRPHRRNALSHELVAALDHAITNAIGDDDTAVLVIAGRGASFCAGADLAYLLEGIEASADPFTFLRDLQACFTRIEHAPKPVIAAVHGHVVAGGLELALACDVVVAQTGTLAGDGHARNGLLPGGGASVRLPRKVGDSFARWLMLSGQLLPIERFLPTGWIHAVATADAFRATVTATAEQLSQVGDDGTHQRMKRLLAHWHDTPEHDGLGYELDLLAEHWRESDVAGRLARFVRKND